MRPGLVSRPWAGIDVGSYSIKVFATQGRVGGARSWQAETPLTVPETERETPAGHEALARIIADCVTAAGLSTRGLQGLTLGISGPDVILKQISLPLMNEEEIGQALRFEARKHLPFDPQGMVIDYQLLGRSITEKRMDVLLAAVSQERLDRLMSPLRLLGLDPDIIDPTPLALTNALFNQVPLRTEPQVMLDIGHGTSHLILHQRSEPFFARRLEFGGRNLTLAIARGMKIPVEEAEAWKVALASDEAAPSADWSLPELKFVLDALHFDLVEELRRSLAFYRTIGKLPETMTLWVSGGSARLPGLTDRLGEQLGCAVQAFDPIVSLNGAPAAAPARNGDTRIPRAPQFTQAVGLALRSP